MLYPDLWGTIIGMGSILTLYFLYKHADSFSNGNIGSEADMTNQHEAAQDKMAEGDMNDRIRIVFWDPWREQFLAVTPDFLVENGVPFNAEAQDYCIYNSTHVTNA